MSESGEEEKKLKYRRYDILTRRSGTRIENECVRNFLEKIRERRRENEKNGSCCVYIVSERRINGVSEER
jgi:hypothetical protein